MTERMTRRMTRRAMQGVTERTGAGQRDGGASFRGAPLALALVLVLTGPLAGQVVSIDETRALRSDATVELGVVTHSLSIEGWDRNEIQIVGEYDSDLEELEIGGNDQLFRMEIDQDDRRGRRRGSSTLEVRLPRGVTLSVGSVSGSVDVRGVTGAVQASSVSGSVDVVGDLSSASLTSVSGSVDFRGDAPTVRMQSVSGGVDFAGDARTVRLQSVSGSVRMEGRGETVEGNSVSGSIEVASTEPVRLLEVESVSGRVTFTGRLALGGTIDVESHSGSVDLVLGGDTDARFELSAFSGSLSSDLPGAQDEVRRSGRFTPNESLSFVTGSGSGRVTASTFSGSIRIRSGNE